MQTEAQRKAQDKYDEKMKAQYHFHFNRKTDADIVQKLESVKSKPAYIKELIKRDIAK